VVAEGQRGPTSGDERATPGPRRYRVVLLRRKWLILLVLALSLGLTTFVTLRQTKRYLASATMILEEAKPRGGDRGPDPAAQALELDTFFNTQLRLIQSSAVAQRAATALGLDQDAKFTGGAKGTEALQAAGDAILACLSARAERHGPVVTVSCVDPSPTRAARIANAVVQAYVDELQSTGSHPARDAARLLGTQADELRQKLEQAERELYEFNKRNDLLATSFEESHRILSSNLFRLNEELSRVRTEGITLKAQADEAKKTRKTQDPAVAAALLGGGQALDDLKHRRAELTKELSALKARSPEGGPKVTEAEAAIAALDKSLQKELDQIYGGLEIKLRANQGQETALVQAIDKEMKRSLKLREHEVEYNRLRREVEHGKEMYAVVGRRLQETELARPTQPWRVRTVEPAVAPRRHFKPDLGLNLLLAAALGLLGGLGLALARELRAGYGAGARPAPAPDEE
jgi:polysaccharide biosynthesis transport protein